MTQYNVTGMSCAACAARVEKAVKGVQGVSECAVSLLTNSMGVEGSASHESIIHAVEQAGYGASLKSDRKSSADLKDRDTGMLEDRETPGLIRRLSVSVVLLLILMYFSMGHTMLDFPIPDYFSGNHMALGLLQMLLATAVMVINQRFFISGLKALWNRSPNMDTLVAIGSSAAFIYSTCLLFEMSGADAERAAMLYHELSFESSATILTFITVGKTLEARAKGKTTDALRSLMKLTPKTARVIRNGEEIEIPAENVVIGDIFTVRPGESIPVDGIVEQGESAVNESSLTGESMPCEKTAGDKVYSGTINTSGFMQCRATSVGEDTTLAQIIKTVSDAAATKAPIAKLADKVSGIFVPCVMAIAAITIIIWSIIKGDFGYSLARGISVLVISCPCALGLATPVAIMVGSGVGAKNGILFKTALSLESTGKITTVVLDKTGTITAGMPEVTDIIPAIGTGKDELLNVACSLEKKSEHPLAVAINKMAEKEGIVCENTDSFEALPGNGLRGEINGMVVTGGNLKFTSGIAAIDSETVKQIDELSLEGKTPLLFTKDGVYLGMIAVADVIKQDSADAISKLKNLGIRTVMLTGDNERTAAAIGRLAGVDEVVAGLLPEDKAKYIEKLQKNGRVAMVGDGINDAVALTKADVGMAIGAGTDVAIDSADVVLMHSTLSDVCSAVRLGRATLRNIRQNLFWAFFYNTIGIPLAAGAFVWAGLTLDPMFGAAAMSLSSVTVVTNALRLNLIRIRSSKHDKKINKNNKTNSEQKEKKEMENTVKVYTVKGMMCAHCEGHVKKALEAIDGIIEATADHNIESVKVVMNADVPTDTIKKAVEEAGYTFVG